MAWQGHDHNLKAFQGAEETRAKMPGAEYNPNIIATRRWIPVVPWRRPSASDTYDPSAPFQRRIIVSPLAVLGIIIACVVIGLFLPLR